MGKTTVKPIGLGYRTVGSTEAYKKLMGVLKGLTVGQDDPDSTEIEAEFYDSPFDIIYDGNPVTFTFELANYTVDELPPLFGGSVDGKDYEGAVNAFTSEHEWELDFQRGFGGLLIYRGLTLGTLKKDEDGALNYNVTITAMTYTDANGKDHMYRILAKGTLGISANTGYTAVDKSSDGYSSANPSTKGWYELSADGNTYTLSTDTTVQTDKTYYTKD